MLCNSLKVKRNNLFLVCNKFFKQRGKDCKGRNEFILYCHKGTKARRISFKQRGKECKERNDNFLKCNLWSDGCIGIIKVVCFCTLKITTNSKTKTA